MTSSCTEEIGTGYGSLPYSRIRNNGFTALDSKSYKGITHFDKSPSDKKMKFSLVLNGGARHPIGDGMMRNGFTKHMVSEVQDCQLSDSCTLFLKELERKPPAEKSAGQSVEISPKPVTRSQKRAMLDDFPTNKRRCTDENVPDEEITASKRRRSSVPSSRTIEKMEIKTRRRSLEIMAPISNDSVDDAPCGAVTRARQRTLSETAASNRKSADVLRTPERKGTNHTDDIKQELDSRCSPDPSMKTVSSSRRSSTEGFSDVSKTDSEKFPPAIYTNRSLFGEDSDSNLSRISTSRVSSSNSLNCNSGNSRLTPCLWNSCGQNVDPDSLLDHLQGVHVAGQVKPDKEEQSFSCRWAGCKVYDRPSCNRDWLEHHVVTHVDGRRYRCIVTGCNQRFSSQFLLTRHVNSHFTSVANGQLRPVRKCDSTSKQARKRKTRNLCIVKKDDLFDACTMDVIQQKLVAFTKTSTQVDNRNSSGSSLTFHGCVVGRRTNSLGEIEVLLHWKPSDILPDEWMPESQVNLQQHRLTLPISSLPRDTLIDVCGAHFVHDTSSHRSRRKQGVPSR